MSVQAMSWVLDHSRSELAARLVLLAIANHCDADGRNAWPSQATIAQEAHVSERTVRRCVAELVELDELTVKLYGGTSSGKGRTNYYELSGYIESRQPRTDQPGTDADTRTSEVDTRTSATPNPDTCGLQTVPEPSVEPSSSSEPSTDPLEACQSEDDVWIEYGHLKAAASPNPIGAFHRWLPKVIADGQESVGHLVEPAMERWPHATAQQIARYLVDRTEPPKPPKVFVCEDCGYHWTGLTAYEDHFEVCSSLRVPSGEVA